MSTIEQLHENFNTAAETIKSSNLLLDNDTLLSLYAYYKQGSVGDCNISSPGFWDLKGSAKYNAWNDLKGKSQEDAMKKYIKKVNKLLS